MTEIAVRMAEDGDQQALAAMIEALDRHYGDPQRQLDTTVAAAARWLRDGDGDTRFALAFADRTPVGLAVFALLYPGRDLSGLLYLKDLFVLAEWRSSGVGGRLMRFLGSYCRAHGIGRMDWQVEQDRAQVFYERLGANVMPEKRFMRIDGDALAELAEG